MERFDLRMRESASMPDVMAGLRRAAWADRALPRAGSIRLAASIVMELFYKSVTEASLMCSVLTFKWLSRLISNGRVREQSWVVCMRAGSLDRSMTLSPLFRSVFAKVKTKGSERENESCGAPSTPPLRSPTSLVYAHIRARIESKHGRKNFSGRKSTRPAFLRRRL